MTTAADAFAKNASRGAWCGRMGLVRVLAMRGGLLQTMGVSDAGSTYLYPEEALFLYDRGSLALADDDVAHAHASLASQPFIVPVYAALKHNGYVVMRARQFARQRHVQRARSGDAGAGAVPALQVHLEQHRDEAVRFQVWRPDQAFGFRRSAPPAPEFAVVPWRVADRVPADADLAGIAAQLPAGARLLVAAVDVASVLFLEFHDGAIPAPDPST
ncbi:tRNA-splicing endonuclease subunit sen54 N-term [Plasmodiophora brassicae]